MVINMKLQVLVAAVNQSVTKLADTMNLESDAIIVNQCDKNEYEEYLHKGRKIRCYSFAERGVGLNRNNGLMRADTDICLFSDEDIVLQTGYEEAILKEYEMHPEADMLIFNLKVDERRATYYNTQFKRIRWYNYGRYPTYSVSAKTKELHRTGVSFSLLFGGGAKYSNGEDSLFLHDCLKKGLKIYASTVVIGEETYRESTWFNGYNQKFFVDRGVLYHFLYGKLAHVFALRFLLAHKAEMCQELSVGEAYRYMKKGIAEGKGAV